MKILETLARLFRRTDNAVVASLYRHALNSPLLVEPAGGARLIDAYMRGAVDYDADERSTTIQTVRVIEISGALVHRPMPGPSGAGPQSYEAIAADFDAAIADPAVSGVILRIDSPGGFAAGLFDLTDRIFQARGKKPIHAVVDDAAFSAAYTIAAAADEIWVTRTGGVGSVGVVVYHRDQSDADKREGVTVTAIHAGARKIDGSPFFPLSEEARASVQHEVDRLYNLLTTSIATYRAVDARAIRATEAGMFFGPEAVARGLADRVGTFADALQAVALDAGNLQDDTRRPRQAAAARTEAELVDAAMGHVRELATYVANETSTLPAAIRAAVVQSLPKLSAITDVGKRVEAVHRCVDAGKFANGLYSIAAKAGAAPGGPIGERAPELLKIAVDKILAGASEAEMRDAMHDHLVEADEAIVISNHLPSGAPKTSFRSGREVPSAWAKTVEAFTNGTQRA